MKILQANNSSLQLIYYPPYKSVGILIVGGGLLALLFLSINYNGQSFVSLTKKFILIAFIILIGIFMGTAAVVTWFFDKNSNKVRQEQKSIRIDKIVEYSIEEILEIQIEQKPSYYIRNNTRHNSYRIILIMANSNFIPLTRDYCFLRRSTAEHIVQSLQQFLSN